MAKIDTTDMPLMNKAVYQLVLLKAEGNVRTFSKMIGMSQQRINRLFLVDKRSGNYPTVSQDIRDVVCEVFGISEKELAKGGFEDLPKQASFTPNLNYEKGIPYYNVPFKMGYELPYDGNTQNPDYLIDFTPFNQCDFWCNASGYSMYPTIASGDYVAMKVINDFRLIVNNEIYGFVLKNGLRTIKRAKVVGDKFILTPDNKEYDEQEVGIEDVLSVFKVMGAVKLF